MKTQEGKKSPSFFTKRATSESDMKAGRASILQDHEITITEFYYHPPKNRSYETEPAVFKESFCRENYSKKYFSIGTELKTAQTV